MNAESTGQKILQAARKVFLEKGMDGARMQEIADLAGINKALLHYYYRNKDQLFAAAIKDLLTQMIPKFFGVFGTDLTFEEKLHSLSRNYTEFLLEHPQLPLLILTEVQRGSSSLFSDFSLSEVANFGLLQQQLDAEASAGRIRPTHVGEFMMNMMSLLVFPHVAKPVFQSALKASDDQYRQMIQSRIDGVPEFILNALKP